MGRYPGVEVSRVSTGEEIVAAVRRSEVSLAEQVSQWESLPYGVAYWSGAFPVSSEANQLRDVWLADVDGAAAYERAEAWFSERGVVCGRWTAASGQPEEPVARLLADRGWRRVEMAAWSLERWDWAQDAAQADIRVLPARAMPKAFRGTFESGGAELAAERLNDSRIDVFVALRGGEPAGRIGYLQVGDVARLTEVFVLPRSRGAGVGRAMAGHVLQLARRLLPKALVASAPSDDAEAAAFLGRCGFMRRAVTAHFERGA